MKFFVVLLMALGCAESVLAQTVDTEHRNPKEHANFCVSQQKICVEKNKWYRQHELVHCKIRYNQCTQELKSE